jgi:hypothetical protein
LFDVQSCAARLSSGRMRAGWIGRFDVSSMWCAAKRIACHAHCADVARSAYRVHSDSEFLECTSTICCVSMIFCSNRAL